MLKRILVPLDTSDFTPAATRMAANIARREQAVVKEPVTLSGLGIVDLDQMPKGRYSKIVPRDQIIAEAEQTVGELVEAFRRTTRELGIPEAQVESSLVSGSPFREIIRESVFCDMIVLGEKCSFPPVNQDYDTMHHLYHQSSRPVVLTQQNFERVDTVVMAMEGTAPSSRMMYNYVHLDPFPHAEVVLAFSKKEVEQYHLEKFYKRVEAFLTSYHLQVRSVALDGGLVEGIAAVVTEQGAQVLALGIHTEHFLDRFRDPLQIRQNYAQRLLNSMSASLFVVH